MTTGAIKDLPISKNQKQGWPWVEETSTDLYHQTNSWPKITIITPSYNQAQFLEETIRSVLLQNYPNLEYIVIDGGSSDHSVEIIRQYETWITYWVSEKDRGQSHAINKGLERATGEIIQWINSDDYYEKSALFNVANLYVKNTDKKVFCFQTKVFGLNTKAVLQTPIGSEKYMFSKAKIEQPSTFFHKDFIKNFKINEDLHFAMDLEMWIAFLLSFGRHYISKSSEIVVNFREHENSKTVSQQNEMILERMRVLYEFEKSIYEKGHYFELSRLPKPELSNALAGSRDFRLFWLHYFISKRDIVSSKKAIKLISFKYLLVKEKFKFFYYKLLLKYIYEFNEI